VGFPSFLNKVCLLLGIVLRTKMGRPRNALTAFPVACWLGVQAQMAFGNSEVVPVYYVLFTLATILSGIVLYRGPSPCMRLLPASCCGLCGTVRKSPHEMVAILVWSDAIALLTLPLWALTQAHAEPRT